MYRKLVSHMIYDKSIQGDSKLHLQTLNGSKAHYYKQFVFVILEPQSIYWIKVPSTSKEL